MLDVFLPPLRILLMASFLLLAKQGWFTWLTPENYHSVVNQIMDFLVVAAPAAYAGWATYHEWRRKRAVERAAQPEVLIAKVADLPQVAAVKVKDDRLADSLGPKVVS